jgi:hypothetical protein
MKKIELNFHHSTYYEHQKLASNAILNEIYLLENEFSDKYVEEIYVCPYLFDYIQDRIINSRFFNCRLKIQRDIETNGVFSGYDTPELYFKFIMKGGLEKEYWINYDYKKRRNSIIEGLID